MSWSADRWRFHSKEGRFAEIPRIPRIKDLPMDAARPTSWRLSEDEVRRRFAWGVQQGVPYWIWPASSIPDWQSALFEIERVARQTLSSGRCDVPLRGKADDIGIAAYTSGMGPLMGYWISAGLLHAPGATEEVLALHYRHNSIRMERLAEQSSRAVAHLTDGGVKVTVLKGLHTAFTCFPMPGTRPTSDIDLMIPPQDKPAADRILRDLNYRPEHSLTEPAEQFWRHVSSSVVPQSLSYVHQDDPWGIDLHTSANRRYAQGAPVIRFDELIDFVEFGRWPLCQGARTLEPAAAVLFLACHASCHFSNLRMLRLVEMVLVIRESQRLPKWTWNEVVELGLQTKTLASAYPALALAETLAPGTVPENVLWKCKSDAPRAVVHVVANLSPATAHRMVRCSLQERYMWTSSLHGKIKQLLYDVVPLDQPFRSWAKIFKIRIWRILRGRLSLRSSNS